MSEHNPDDHIRLLQAQTEELERASTESNRAMMLSLERTMSDKFRILREERGWSQKELADKVRGYGFDFHQSTIAKLESGARPLRVAEMYALSHVFRLPPGAVFFMAYTSESYSSFDELTRMLAREEEHRAETRAMLIENLERTIDVIADRQTSMNQLVDTMRRIAASEPSLAEERERLKERYPEPEPRASMSASELLDIGDQTIDLLRRGPGDGEHQAKA